MIGLRLCAVTLLCGAAVSAWQTDTPKTPSHSAGQASSDKTKTPAKAGTPKLTPSEKQAFALLESAHGQMGSFSAETQAYLLQEMAAAYQSIDRAKQIELLKEALEAATRIEDGNRVNTESELILYLQQADPKALESMVNDADASLRLLARQYLLSQEIDEGRMDTVVQWLCQWDDPKSYPYDGAGRVISKLKPEQSAERQAVFAASMAAFRNDGQDGYPMSAFEFLVSSQYDQLPPAMVIQAIDLLLSRAAEFDEKPVQVSFQVGGDGGEASFTRLYDYQLFVLMPVLQRLDPGKAKALLREHEAVAALMKKYPEGKSSLSPGDPNRARMTATSAGKRYVQEGLQREREQQLSERILESASSNFDDAVARAQTLSNEPTFDGSLVTPRTQLLVRLARRGMGMGDMSHAAAALKALASASQNLEPRGQLNYVLTASAISAQLGDISTSKKYLGRAMKIAEDIYQEDAFGDPPNLAAKAFWPSTAGWRASLVMATRIDPGFALEQCASLPDPEIKAVEQVSIASVLLGGRPQVARVSVYRKGKDSGMGAIQIPSWRPPMQASVQQSMQPAQ